MKKNTIPISSNNQLLSEWDWDSNNMISLFPEKTSVNSHKKAYWKCVKHNQIYTQIIRDRYRGTIGCELCKKERNSSIPREKYISNKPVLAVTHPNLASEWFFCKDSRFSPYTTVSGSSTLVTWKCSKCEVYLMRLSAIVQ